jgi:hypothetical protein
MSSLFIIAPPGPVSNLQVTMPSATTITITWTVDGDVDRFDIAFSSTFNRCSVAQGATPISEASDGSVMSHTLYNLNEDSRYTITVTAINSAGSTMAMITADTLTSGNADYVIVMCMH